MSRYDEKTMNEVLDYAEKYSGSAASKKYGVSKTNIYYHLKKRKAAQAQKTSKVIEPINPATELMDNPKITFEESEEREIKRGDIYYVHKYATTGSEIATGRPAIIISNNRLNAKLNVVEVVFLTSKPKIAAPEHLTISSTSRLSTVLCEQISSVDKACLGNFVAHCTPDEMKRLDKALLASLGLDTYADTRMSDDQIVARITAIKAERDAYKTIYDQLLERNMQRKE